MDRNSLLHKLSKYATPYPEEVLFIPRFLSLLTNFPNCYKRSLVTGHMTGSAWIVNENANAVLLVHHKKLDRWLQPGGHADGEENIINVTIKEGKEETGMRSLRLVNEEIFDVDIHQIPEHKGVKAHLHHDIRFLFQADQSEKIVVSHESNEVAWFPLDKVGFYTNNNRSIHRMILKTKLIFK
jgi:8-oxo-dGTP pyrophosphatase MutT (NUDIX family)